MVANARRQVEQAARSVLAEVRQIAPQITGCRVIVPFAADNAFVVYYVLANRQELQATVNILSYGQAAHKEPPNSVVTDACGRRFRAFFSAAQRGR